MGQDTRSFLLERAQEIREKSVELILQGNYEAFLELGFIAEEIWNTQGAKNYRQRLKSAVIHRNKAFLMEIPEHLESIASKMPTPKPFKFSYEGLIKKADEIDFKMIDFILNGDYDSLLRLATISEEIWSGKNAEKYKQKLEKAVKMYDKKYLASIPQFLRKKAEELLANEKAIKDVLEKRYQIKI